MCGIAGFYGDFDESLLHKMNSSIAHRGPDDEGIFFSASSRIGLAHRRLSIIDISDHGHQPMWDSQKNVAITFNGEIYNYKKLRDDLISQGIKFNSESDTEVLIYLYLQYGEQLLSKLNGIFAFAIWDTRTETLFLARDGVGVKPLYYSNNSRGFIFSSELKAILQDPQVDRSINPQAIHYHLSYLWCPAPHTMLMSIKKLEPGHALIIKNSQIKKHWEYYDLPYEQSISTTTEDDAIEQVQSLISKSVNRQMVSDVPVGAFLSGGLDSSSIVSFAKNYSGEKKLKCFTIGFKGNLSSIDSMNEDLPYAKSLAKHLDVDLHTITTGSEMINNLQKMIYHLDEPQADPSAINILLICQLAKEHGIKVLLSGAGGDDIFTGYRRHYALMQEYLWTWLPKSGRVALSKLSGQFGTSNTFCRQLSKAFKYADLENDSRLISYFWWLDPNSKNSLYSDDFRDVLRKTDIPDPLLTTLKNLPKETFELNRMLYLEGKHFLPDHNLNYTDKMSMATGVEVRVPLLDPDLIKYACQLPLNFKQRGKTGKWIFKKAMEPYLPRKNIYRKKIGFGAPLRYWILNDLQPLISEILSESSIKKRDLFNHQEVNNLINLNHTGKLDASYTIFSLICIELWCRIFIDQSTPSQNTV